MCSPDTGAEVLHVFSVPYTECANEKNFTGKLPYINNDSTRLSQTLEFYTLAKWLVYILDWTTSSGISPEPKAEVGVLKELVMSRVDRNRSDLI